MAGTLLPRYCTNGYCYSTWEIYGRWIAFGIILVVAFLIFFTFACFKARRRRHQGMQPYPGTGWMAPPPGPPPPGQPQYQQPFYGDPYYTQNPPPQYSANPQNYGYFGSQPQPQQREGQQGQSEGIEMQAPANVYQGSDQTHAPPPGPPPNKTS